MPTSFSPNKNYQLQATGEDVNTWGINLNSNFSEIDLNLGGTLPISVAGNSNVTLTSSQTQNLIHNLTGVLTGNINYIFPDAGGFFLLNNNTTGAFTITATVTGGSGGVLLPQGSSTLICIDASVPKVTNFTGTQYIFSGGTVSGTNTLTISSTLPSSFSLTTGTILTITPPNPNTTSVTLAVNGGSAVTIQKITASGTANLGPGDIGGFPLIMQYNGTVWIALNVVINPIQVTVSTNQAITFANLFQSITNTASITYTITQTTNLAPYWYISIFAEGGAATIVINAADSINGGAAGVGLAISRGASGVLSTDANGNLFFRTTSLGTITNDAASSGNIGEYQFTNIPVGSAVGLSSGNIFNVGSLSLTAGDWDVYGNVVFLPTGNWTAAHAWTNTASATQPTIPNNGAYTEIDQPSASTGGYVTLCVGAQRISLSTTTTIYLGCTATFSTGANSAFGFIGARRRR